MIHPASQLRNAVSKKTHSANNDISIQHPEIIRTTKKEKSISVKSSRFYFLIPRRVYKIRRWKRNTKLNRFNNVVEDSMDHERKIYPFMNAVDDNSFQSNLAMDTPTDEEVLELVDELTHTMIEINQFQ